MIKIKNLANRFMVLILILGMMAALYGLFIQLKENRKREIYETTNAYIFKTVNKSDGRQILYIRYDVSGVTYEKVLINDKEPNNTSYIKIYYNFLNPEEFTIEEKDVRGKYLIIGGSIAIIFSIIQMVILKKLIKL